MQKKVNLSNRLGETSLMVVDSEGHVDDDDSKRRTLFGSPIGALWLRTCVPWKRRKMFVESDWVFDRTMWKKELKKCVLFFHLSLQRTHIHKSKSVPWKPRVNVFMSADFQKTNTLQALMSACCLRGTDKRGYADLQKKKKQPLNMSL